ncbi:hypothetical protein ABZZ74_46670 [Streptomyces sp. NPDC006476]|uniref:hypothetical protein n=1 Tax=Streptomyces sp. NPDC006476 TaxID=3157175 RepID=UPI0033B262F6
MHYFINDNGGWMSVSGDSDVLAVVPDGYREVSEAEFNEAAGIIVLPAPEQQTDAE